MKLNQNYNNLVENYLFATVSKKTEEFRPSAPMPIIRMGIGDVTLPLCPAVIEAGHKAVDEMGQAETFKGYGPYEGYLSVREAISGYYTQRGIDVKSGDIFVSDGAKCDIANILDIFDKDNTVLIPDPVYPVYLDTNIMDGRKVKLIDANEANGFLPLPDFSVDSDIIYLCSPNNPTGAVYSKDALSQWVRYAKEKNAVILFDAAYEFFVRDSSLPRSIFEIEGADEVAIEFCSFSKTAGFTGTRLGYIIITDKMPAVKKMWLRRQSTKFNGVSYIVQKMGEAIYSEKGMKEIAANVDKYMKNAALMTKTLDELGIKYTGGKNSPYVWFKCPGGDSWEFFDFLLKTACVVGTPGAGFGKCGEGWFRLTAFASHQSTVEAMARMKEAMKKLK